MWRTAFLLWLILVLAACSSEPAPATDAGSDAGDDGGPIGEGGAGAPSLARVGDKRAVVDRPLVIELRATDPEGDRLDFSIFGDLPAGAKFDKETARFNWTPTQADLGSQWLITFAVSDGRSSDRETITITVAATDDNGPPVFVDPGDQILPVNQPYELLLEATDPNGDILHFMVVGSQPEGSTFDDVQGVFRWTPGADREDTTHRVLFRVSDGIFEADLFVNFRVGSAGLAFPAIEPVSVALGESLSLVLVVTNPSGASYTCQVLGATPTGSSFDTTACTFSWTPGEAALVGTAVQVVFQVSDSEVTLVQTASISIKPAGSGGGGGSCEPDGLESVEAAGETPLLDPGAHNDLTLCGDDVDFFAVQLASGQEVEITIAFEHDTVDVDLALYVPGNTDSPYRVSDGVADSETIRVEAVPQPGAWGILVYPIEAVDTTYDLTITVSDTASCVEDAHEENDSSATAAPLTLGQELSAQHCASDPDFYSFAAQAGQSLSVDLASQAGVDLDLSIFAPGASSPAWEGLDIGDTEHVDVENVPATGTYAIEIFDILGVDSPYTLTVAVTGQACTADAHESGLGDDTPDDANDLAPGPGVANLTWCDPDYFWFVLDPGEGALVGVNYDTRAFGRPTAILHRIDLPNERLGEVEGDTIGVTIYLEAAPTEDIYVAGVTAADNAMAYEIELFVYPPL